MEEELPEHRRKGSNRRGRILDRIRRIYKRALGQDYWMFRINRIFLFILKIPVYLFF